MNAARTLSPALALPYNAPVRSIAVINQKGGVGKTTTVANLGAALADRGIRTCLLDLDPQAHLTLHFGIEPGTPEAGVYEMLTESATLDQAAVDVRENLAVVPSVIDLAAAEVELVTTVGREQILRDRLAAAGREFDLAICDCPPSLGLLTLNALAACDDVLIPLQPHFLALQGLGKLLETVALVQQRINPKLTVAGVILCMYESTTRLTAEVQSDLKEFFDASSGGGLPWDHARIFDAVIRRNVKLAECPSHGLSIFEYEPRCNGATDYQALADELLATLGMVGPEQTPADTGPAIAEPVLPPSAQPPTPAPTPPADAAEPADASAPPADAHAPTPAPPAESQGAMDEQAEPGEWASEEPEWTVPPQAARPQPDSRPGTGPAAPDAPAEDATSHPANQRPRYDRPALPGPQAEPACRRHGDGDWPARDGGQAENEDPPTGQQP